MRVRPHAGMTQRFWRVLGPGSGLAGLQSRRLTALLVRAAPPLVCPIIGHVVVFDSPIPEHSVPATATQRRRTQLHARQCSPLCHFPRADQSRRHSSVAPVPTQSRSHGRAPLSRLRSGLLPPHRHPRHLVPRPCQRN